MIARREPGIQQSLQGKLELAFGIDRNGMTVPLRSFRKGLFHFGKPYKAGDTLVLQVLNPTAGIFEGDHLESNILIDRMAKVCLVSPSSTQVYCMPGKGMARSRQAIILERGGSFACLPKALVLHADSSFSQETTIRMERGSSLLFLEQISAGRQGFGESVEYRHFDGKLSIFLDDRIMLRERIQCGRDKNSWIWNMKGKRGSIMANLYISFPGAVSIVGDSLLELINEAPGSILGGVSPLDDDFLVVRTLSDGSASMHEFIGSVYRRLDKIFPVAEVCGRIG